MDCEKDSLHQLESLLRVLHLLRSRYSGAEFVTKLVDSLMRILPAKLPSQLPQSLMKPLDIQHPSSRVLLTLNRSESPNLGNSPMKNVGTLISSRARLHGLNNSLGSSKKSRLVVWAIESIHWSFSQECITLF
jgi:hypothetical protein